MTICIGTFFLFQFLENEPVCAGSTFELLNPIMTIMY